jgi:hypothetical protein
VGVLATTTASPLPPSPLPTPSMITRTMGFSMSVPPKSEYYRRFLHSIGCIILHHFSQTYNHFLKFSLPYKKTTGKPQKWVIFPVVVKKV